MPESTIPPDVGTCDRCGGEFPRDVWGGLSHYTSMTYCYACDSMLPDCEAGPGTCPECERHQCDDCRQDWERQNGAYDDDNGQGINYYSFRPRLSFHGTGSFYIGVELEIETDRRNALPVLKWARENGSPELFFCKEDSSVNGFEIVTHPMTGDYFHGVDWDSFFAMLNCEYPREPNRNGHTENREHGIHVHVSRSAFPSPSVLARWSYLVNRNTEQVRKVARRYNSQWAAWSGQPVGDVLMTCGSPTYDWVGEPAREVWDETLGHYVTNPAWLDWSRTNSFARWQRKVSKYRHPQRYQALNHTNSDTVEVRAFRSTRNPAHFRETVGFVLASVEYVRSMQASRTSGLRDALAWDAFVDYVAEVPTYAGIVPALTGTEGTE